MKTLTKFEGQDNEFGFGMLAFGAHSAEVPKWEMQAWSITKKKFPSGLGPPPIFQKFLTLDKPMLKCAGNLVGVQDVFDEQMNELEKAMD